MNLFIGKWVMVSGILLVGLVILVFFLLWLIGDLMDFYLLLDVMIEMCD